MSRSTGICWIRAKNCGPRCGSSRTNSRRSLNAGRSAKPKKARQAPHRQQHNQQHCDAPAWVPSADVQLHHPPHQRHQHHREQRADVNHHQLVVQKVGQVKRNRHPKREQDDAARVHRLRAGHAGTPGLLRAWPARAVGRRDRSRFLAQVLCRMDSTTASGESSAVSTVRCAWRYQGRRALQRSARRARSASTGRTGPSACPAQRANNVSSGASRNTTSAFGQRRQQVAR